MRYTDIKHKLDFVGTCVNSFDDDGYCEINELPYSDVTDFAVAEEEAIEISKNEFTASSNITKELAAELSNDLIFLKADSVVMVYDNATDIHYFFA